jgi:hypothetical protein
MKKMENTNRIVTETQSTSIVLKNKAAIIGFLLMLAGPIILFLAGLFTKSYGDMPKTAANIVSWVTAILPGVGAVISIISLIKWNKTGKLGRALSIVTVIMCNPFFYIVYLFMCMLSSSTLAGLSWM